VKLGEEGERKDVCVLYSAQGQRKGGIEGFYPGKKKEKKRALSLLFPKKKEERAESIEGMGGRSFGPIINPSLSGIEEVQGETREGKECTCSTTHREGWEGSRRSPHSERRKKRSLSGAREGGKKEKGKKGRFSHA